MKENAEREGTMMKIDSMLQECNKRQHQLELRLKKRLKNDETEQKQLCGKLNQNQIGRALTGQRKLIADTDNARSPNRICNEASTQRTKERWRY